MKVQESSVSRNVVKLEQLLEMQLFERDVRGVRLTETGRAWTGVARAHYEGLLEAFAGCVRDNKDAKTLRVGLCWVKGGEFLKRLIDRFGNLYPDVSLSIEDIPAGQCLAAIRRRRLDIAFTHDLGVITSCCSEVFWQERLFVLLPTCHSLIDKPAVTWSDLADMCLLVPVGLEGPPLDLRYAGTHCGRWRPGCSGLSSEPGDNHLQGATRSRRHFRRRKLCQDNGHRFRDMEASRWPKQCQFNKGCLARIESKARCPPICRTCQEYGQQKSRTGTH